MLLFNQKTYALGDSVSNFNTSNVTIQLYNCGIDYFSYVFQYI